MRGHDLFRYTAIAAVLFCYVTIMLGGNVMASDSGLACPDWPTCHGSLAPPIGGGTGIEWSHRVSAFLLAVVITVLAVFAVAFERTRPVALRLSLASLATVVAQALLGGLVVESDLTVVIVLLHLALATALFGLLLVLAFLANLREVPRRFVEWARRAAEEESGSVLATSSGPTGPVPATPNPSPRPAPRP
jgi:cytochrome c oxidase assembly protein subunit 15